MMEAIGTFALWYVGGWAVEWSIEGKIDLTGVALAHAIVLAMFIYIGADISGSHFNPAVTLALWLTGYQKPEEGVLYAVAQWIGSMVAGFVLLCTRSLSMQAVIDSNQLGHPKLSENESIVNAFILEAIATGFLVLSVFSAGVHKKANSEVTAWLVGLTLGFMIFAIGNYTGAALNPCRVIGPSFFSGSLVARGSFVYILGPLLGGACAGYGYNEIFIPKQRENEELISLALNSELNKTYRRKEDENL